MQRQDREGREGGGSREGQASVPFPGNVAPSQEQKTTGKVLEEDGGRLT